MIPQSIHLQLIRLEPTSEPVTDPAPETRYELVLPLNTASRVDVETWRKHRHLCIVRRLIPGGDAQVGKLGRATDGRLRFNCCRGADDETAFTDPGETFALGDSVPMEDERGQARLYRVVCLERI